MTASVWVRPVEFMRTRLPGGKTAEKPVSRLRNPYRIRRLIVFLLGGLLLAFFLYFRTAFKAGGPLGLLLALQG